MSAFAYTDFFRGDGSEIVKQVIYNQNTKKLIVWLTNDWAYKYENVPPKTYLAWKDASSKGSFYNISVKPYFTLTSSGYRPEGFAATRVSVESKDRNKNMEFLVKFEADGKLREHTPKVATFEEAVATVEDFGKVLNKEFKIKEVVVKFV